ncbi:metal ABC transporter substrate-binding protein [Rhodoblastus sp. 17X3]|uniref:metal ABC transporter substrate-binding protein n=1 Tax=Rhodoblastus sp. 17X3 TaxID=3047026 RepID=UPI0024B7A4A0|nr:metal ABC transporter substrate-binding protein [Rhodoblastus sp. 17X3]MDI9847651.1 metal ABC transporter substrate-binding protein [Rhodoblastus sp. 17X3]
MRLQRVLIRALTLLLAFSPLSARAEGPERLPVVASFSILADFVRQIGGDKVAVKSLVGPNGDAHVFQPSPTDAQSLAGARLIVVNGLALEGWMSRLIAASGAKAPVVVASRGVKPREGEEEGKKGVDPHAWQSIANAKIYVGNILAGLIAADPADADFFRARAQQYELALDETDRKVRAAIASIPPENRKIITTHDAFGYFGEAYGFTFIAPLGLSTDSEPSARDVARLITQIKHDKAPAVFLENISDPRLMKRIGQESGAKIGGDLYSDSLSTPDGPAGTYIAMMEHNIVELKKALAPNI